MQGETGMIPHPRTQFLPSWSDAGAWKIRKSLDDVAGPWWRNSVFEFRSPGPIRITIWKDASINHPYDSPCVVTAQAAERYATTSPYRPVSHVDCPPGGGRALARGRRHWPESVMLGSLLDSVVGESSYPAYVWSLQRVTERARVRKRPEPAVVKEKISFGGK